MNYKNTFGIEAEMEQISNLLYEEQNNLESYLSFLPKDILNVCLQYTAENFKRERNKWIKHSMNIQYLRAIRLIEINEHVRFPIIPVLDMAIKDWADNIYYKYPKPSKHSTWLKHWEWKKWYRCQFFCSSGKEALATAAYVEFLPRPFRVYNGMWMWNFADILQMHKGGVTYHFILYEDPKDNNPKMFTLEEKIDDAFLLHKEDYFRIVPGDVTIINRILQHKDPKWFDDLPSWKDKYDF